MEIIKADNKNIQKIVAALKNGAVLILPTDTVYGLVCDAKNEKAVGKIFEIKKRNKNNPVPVFVRDIKMAKEYAVISQNQEGVINKSWPGAETFILVAKSGLASLVYKENTIGMRVPDSKLINEIFAELDSPLAQTSANISGGQAPVRAQEVKNNFKDKDVIFVDAGDLPNRQPSTIIDLSRGKIKILRP